MSRSGSKKSNKNIATFVFKGKTYKYSSAAERKRQIKNIAKKEESSVEHIMRRINNQRRIVFNAQSGDVIPVNMLRDNISGILKTQFGVGRVLSKNIYTDKKKTILNKKKEIELVKKVDGDEDVKLFVRVIYFVTPLSYGEDSKKNKKLREIVYRTFKGKDNIIGYGKKPKKEVIEDLKNSLVREFDMNFEGTGAEIYQEMYGDLKENINVFLRSLYSAKGDMIGAKNGVYGKILEKCLTNVSGWGIVDYIHVDVMSVYNKRKLKLSKDGTISEPRIFQLEEWANIVYDNEGDEKDSCALKFISSNFSEFYWDFKGEETITDHGIKYMETDKFLNICEGLNICYEVYNVYGKLERKHIPEYVYGVIRCIIYQGHIYPMTGGKLRRRRNTEYKIKHVKDNDSFLKKINNLTIPSRIIIAPSIAYSAAEAFEKLNNITVSSFTSNGIRYINNPEYNECYNFLKKVSLLGMMRDDIKMTSLINILEKSMKVPDTKSFIPENYLFTKKPLLWKTDKKIDHKNVIVKDKNKAYACALYNLPYLIKFDFRKNGVRKFNDKENIVDSHLYFVTIEEWTTAIPENNLYSGYHLKECIKYGVQFEIVEELQTSIVPNYYRKLIDVTKKYLDEETFKNIWVRYIGCMESSISSSHECKFKAICTDDQKDFYSGHSVKFSDKYNMIFSVKETYKNVRNRFPIASQIKDMSRMTIIREINKMGLKDDDIVQLKTDAIAYYGEKSKELDPKDFFGWKDEVFNEMNYVAPLNKSCIRKLGEIPVEDKKLCGVLDLFIDDDKKRVRKLHMQYAGSGKTTYIIKKLIPKLLKTGYTKDDIIVLTPTHYTLAEYKREGINCEIIQKYTFDNTIAKEKYVIVDEIGCIETSCHDMLYKLVQAGKNIECFGDFNQLQPIGEDEQLNQEHYLNYLFKEINTDFTNYRNKFTKEYYDSLIFSKVDISKKDDVNRSRLISEITKWQAKNWKKADYIVCFRHTTRQKWNKIVLRSLGKKTWMSVGIRIVCKNNKLKDLNIWNKKEFVIKRIIKEDEKKFVLEDKFGLDKDVTVTEKQLKSNFSMAYACNVHQIQGSTLNSYYWASEDDKFVNGNIAYTIISRLRQRI